MRLGNGRRLSAGEEDAFGGDDNGGAGSRERQSLDPGDHATCLAPAGGPWQLPRPPFRRVTPAIEGIESSNFVRIDSVVNGYVQDARSVDHRGHDLVRARSACLWMTAVRRQPLQLAWPPPCGGAIGLEQMEHPVLHHGEPAIRHAVDRCRSIGARALIMGQFDRPSSHGAAPAIDAHDHAVRSVHAEPGATVIVDHRP